MTISPLLWLEKAESFRLRAKLCRSQDQLETAKNYEVLADRALTIAATISAQKSPGWVLAGGPAGAKSE